MNNRVVHFEIQVDDIDRAKKFYGDVFGWGWQDWSGVTGTPYWGILTAPMPARPDDSDHSGGDADGTPSKEPGINGGLLKRPCAAPKLGQPARTADSVQSGGGTNAFVCTIQVENFDEVAKKIIAAGGVEAMPKMDLGGMAWQGYFLDTEGNTFGLHQTIKKDK